MRCSKHSAPRPTNPPPDGWPLPARPVILRAMRRRHVIVGLIVAAVAVVVAVAHWPRGPQPCRATFALVREGMTFEEVCAAVGGPPGDYTGGTRVGLIDLNGPATLAIWTATDGELLADFNYDGRLAWAQVIDVSEIPRPPLFARLLSRLGL